MPISTSSFEDGRDGKYQEYEDQNLYEEESIEYPGLTLETAQGLLKRLGGGVSEKFKLIEGIGWKAIMTKTSGGVEVSFDAHEELLDDLIRRFEGMVDKAL